MDRRQKKTREAIFEAFSRLLSQKSFSQITVGEIIQLADVGRATFYAHFETKDYLLRELCRELFCHVFDAAENEEQVHQHIFHCHVHESVFLHLFRHFRQNDHHILDLLAGENSDLFLQYFKAGLTELIDRQLAELAIDGGAELPRDYLVSQIAACFVETLRWWIAHRLQETPEVITAYFLRSIHASPILDDPKKSP